MKWIEVKPFASQPPAGTEWQPSTYPGDGVYLLPDGRLIIVSAGLIMGGVSAPGLIRDGTLGGAGGVDVNRMLDQLLELRGPIKP